MTSDLTTPERVRNRLKDSPANLTNQVIQEYIDDATAYIQREARKTFTQADSLYELARSCCTNIAAFYCIIRSVGGTTDGLDYTIDELRVRQSDQLKAKLSTANTFIAQAEKELAGLQDEDTDYPQSNTGLYG